MAKTVVKASFVRVYNTYIPHDSQLWMGKTKHIREYATRTGKFMQVNTKRKVDTALVVILLSVLWPTFYISLLHVVMMVEGYNHSRGYFN